MKNEKKKNCTPQFDSCYDPFGSYTGKVECGSKYEKPVQDADDL